MFERRFIKSIRFNRTDEDYDYATVGLEIAHLIGDKRIVKKIQEHSPQGEGDRWFYDIIFENGEMLRVFNMSEVEFGEIITR